MGFSPDFKQTFAVAGVVLNYVGCGCSLGFPTILLPNLLKKNDAFRIDTTQSSWIASSRSFTSIALMLLLPPLMEKRGRKIAHIASITPALISWIVIALAQGYPALMLGVLLQGATYGGCISVGPVAIAEFSSPRHRGVFVTLICLAVALGISLTHVLGTYLDWRTVAWIMEIPIVLSLIITTTWKESPFWLAEMGRFEECAESFYWYRGYDKKSNEELEKLIADKKEMQLDKVSEQKTNIIRDMKDVALAFTRKDFLKPFALAIAACSVFDLSGRGVVIVYSISILRKMGMSESAAYLVTILTDVATIAGLLTSGVLTKLLKRRSQMFLSAGLGAFFIGFAAILQRLHKDGYLSLQYAWLSAASLVLFVFAMCLGASVVAIGLMGEIFPMAYKGLGASISGIYISFTQVLVTKTAPFSMAAFGVDGQLFMHASMLALTVLILYFIQPETKGKTLREIEYIYTKVRAVDEETEPMNTK